MSDDWILELVVYLMMKTILGMTKRYASFVYFHAYDKGH